MPFAITNPIVSDIRINSTDWIGTLAVKDVGLWLDTGLLLVFGGIPWQVSFFFIFLFFFYLFNFTMDIQCSSSCFQEVMIMRYIEMNMMSYKCKHKQ